MPPEATAPDDTTTPHPLLIFSLASSSLLLALVLLLIIILVCRSRQARRQNQPDANMELQQHLNDSNSVEYPPFNYPWPPLAPNRHPGSTNRQTTGFATSSTDLHPPMETHLDRWPPTTVTDNDLDNPGVKFVGTEPVGGASSTTTSKPGGDATASTAGEVSHGTGTGHGSSHETGTGHHSSHDTGTSHDFSHSTGTDHGFSNVAL
ncbi:hypothetical protein EJ06DRAFT_584600 [Trichodelitschia bisporula]|uniref:Uncharacterized protein n=1 Tax=Trichodelitschia bisporula TaxID=703511 RepID=A0A6G1HML8_9PEZI|nr:hypothetical protein EJ06DRAFT_584600 [Trichodelitschia bisporula]